MTLSAHKRLHLDWRRRATYLLGLLLLLFAGLGYRFVELMVGEHDHYLARSRRNAIIVESMPAARGRILDRSGKTIVGNYPVYDLYLVPAEIERSAPLLNTLCKLLGEDRTKLRKAYEESYERAPLEEMIVKRSLSDSALTLVSELVDETPGVYLASRAQRRYPHGKTASHLLGYVGAISQEKLRDLRDQGYTGRDFVGKTGLEAYYDKQLRGQRGVRHRWVDASGRTLKTEVIEPPHPGQDVYLNIDLELQKLTEKTISEALATLKLKNGEPSGAAAVVYDVRNGQILTLASLPNFDPRPFARGIKTKEYRALLNDKSTPLVNRATHASFSPGSTFKIVTGMAALDLGICSPNSYFTCGGSYKGANCFVRSGHGGISFRDSIAHSCDVVFYSLGDKMGITNLARYSRGAGLGSVTGIDLPGEDPGLIPDPAWKEEVWGEPWYGGDTINSSIGQGFILTTPLQMARVIAAVANSGVLTKPRLVDRAVDWRGRHAWQNGKVVDGKLEPSVENLEVVRQGMRGAVTHGTSTVVNSPSVKVAGKTGTVESFPNPYNPKGRNHTWFVCFAPYENPEIAVAVFFQKSGGYGGSVSAPVARRIIDAYFGEKS